MQHSHSKAQQLFPVSCMRYVLPIALGILALPASAVAGGFEIGDNGTRSLGRAGAYVAGVDEPSALYYNPAALTRISGTAMTLNLNLVDYNATFQRSPFIYNDESGTDPEREIQFDEVSQQTALFPAPMFFLSTDFGLENWAFAIGAYGPSAFGAPSYPEFELPADDFEGDICPNYRPCNDSRSTPDIDESVMTRDGGQAYMIIDQTVILAYPSLAVAHRFEQLNLSVGLTLQLATLFVDYAVGVDGDLSQEADYDSSSIEAFDFYTPNTLAVKGLGFTGILGVLYEPTESLSFGASYRPQFNLVGKGDVDLVFPDGLSGAGISLSETTAEIRFSLPDVVRFGVEYAHRNEGGKSLVDIELDFVWENWSVLDAFRVNVPGQVSDVTGTLDQREIPALDLRREYNDSWSLRLGTELNMLRDEDGAGPAIRFGALYETSSVEEEWTNLDFTPFARVAGTFGFSYHLKQWSIDLAYAYFWSPTREVGDGEGSYNLLVPLWVCEDPSNANYPAECGDLLTSHQSGHAVNEGTYKTWTQTFSLGATYGW
jgi:long-chain fatty acid transport protein